MMIGKILDINTIFNILFTIMSMESNCFDYDSDIESDDDCDVASDHLHQIKELTNGLESKLKALTFGMGSKFNPIVERIRKIRDLSEI